MIPTVRACGFASRKNKDLPRMKRWSGTKKLKWVDVNKIWSKMQGQPPRQNMLPGDGEMTSCYYMSFQEYVYGEGKTYGTILGDKTNLRLVCRPVNTEQPWNDISFDDPIVSQRNYNEQVVQDEVMNKNNTTENIFGDIQDDKVLEERNEYAVNKFDDDVFDVNDYSEVKEEWEERNDNAGNKFDDDVPDEDELIITGIVDYFDDDDGKEDSKTITIFVPSLHRVAHDTEAKKKEQKRRLISNQQAPFLLQFLVVVIQNYIFHSYDVQHRLFNFVLDRDFWSSLFGHTHDGWLESAHITIWYRLLKERRFESDRHTIMPPNFFVSHALEEGQDWRAFMAGIATYPNFMVAWWDVDTVLLPIHSSPNHWLFGELRLASMEVHIYDSLGRGAYEKFKSEGIFSKFERRVANYLDKIKYWARRNIPRIPLNMQFIYEENVPQQSSHLGDCGVFVCMFMEQLVSGQPIRVLIDPKNAALEFRLRMAKITWGSSLGRM
uniref:Ubiquitin-like protease family profile domain-containing protein n=2 Tax=Lactuca sativa TaxID=4236 RepID=A0A9R1UPN5_LACSA|nr:hypothetical protein LSAT_V11C800402260 [Lactuca sativa]